MTQLNYAQALQNAIHLSMQKDERVILLGEDIGKLGGVFRITAGLLNEFGEERVIDTPLAESGIVGSAIGMALYGLRPVAEIQFADFIYPAFDQIVNELAKYRYRSGGQYSCPVIVRAPCGGGIKGGLYHSQSPEAYFIHTAGLRVVMPASPYDAKGMFLAALRQNDPIIFFEPKRLYRAVKEEVPEGEYLVELGKAKIMREGSDITLLTYGASVLEAEEAAKKAEEEDIKVELIDLRSLLPFDEDTVVESVKKTGRVVLVNEAPKTCGFTAELMATIVEKAFTSLEAPPVRVSGFDTPFPFAHESSYLPSAPRILKAIRDTAKY